MIGIENRTVPIGSLFPHPRNYRFHPENQIRNLCASYRRLGQFRSVVVVPDEQGRFMLVAGHGFVEAMKREGATDVRVEILPKGTSVSTIEAIMVADNLHSQFAQDDEATLAELLQAQIDAGFSLESVGSDEEALRQLLESLGDAMLESDESEDLVDISSEKGNPTETILRLKFGKYEVPLTQDEYQELESRLQEYSDEMGSYHGFARSLL